MTSHLYASDPHAKMTRLERKELIQHQLQELPSANKPRASDGSALFKVVGGSADGYTIRIYLPLHEITFPSGDTYEPSEPLTKRSKAWIYIKKDNNARQTQ